MTTSAFRLLWLALLVLRAATAAIESSERHSSVAVALSRRGLSFFSSIGHKIVNHELPKLVFPDFQFPIAAGPGFGAVRVHKLHVPKLDSPLFHFELSPPSGIAWTSEGGALKLAGRWQANYTVLTTFYLHGWVEVIASDVRAHLTLGAYGARGHPQLRVLRCTVDVLDVHLTLGGGIVEWIVNLFKSDLSWTLKRVIHEQLCELMQTTLLDQANEALLLIPKHVDIAGDVYLNYELAKMPVKVTNDSVIGRGYMDVMLANQTCSIAPQPLNLDTIDNRYMVNIWVSETIVNCLLESAHRTRLLRYNLTRDVYAQLDTFLSTSCRWYQVCVGKFIRPLRERWPARGVEFRFYSAAAPTTRLVERHNATITARFYVDLHVQADSRHNASVALVRIEMRVNASVTPIIANRRVGGLVNATSAHFSQVFSRVGNVSDAFFTTLEMLLNPIIKVVSSTILSRGFSIPVIDNIVLDESAKVDLIPHGIRVKSDLASPRL